VAQSPHFEGFSTANPIEVLRYSYSLDGTPGTRTVDAAIWRREDGTNPQFVDFDFGISTPLYLQVSLLPGSITVVPSPAPLAAFALGGGLALSRRRRH
jgi:hypothetical protein